MRANSMSRCRRRNMSSWTSKDKMLIMQQQATVHWTMLISSHSQRKEMRLLERLDKKRSKTKDRLKYRGIMHPIEIMNGSLQPWCKKAFMWTQGITSPGNSKDCNRFMAMWTLSWTLTVVKVTKAQPLTLIFNRISMRLLAN